MVTGGDAGEPPRNKIFAESPSKAEFLQIFENCCRDQQLEYRPDVVEGLLSAYFKPRQIQLRGCQPRDLLNQVVSLAEYLGERPAVSADLLEAACAAYFVDDRELPASYA